MTQTLLQIGAGVKDAQMQGEDLGMKANPPVAYHTHEVAKYGITWAGDRQVQVIQFDVALTVLEGTGTKGGIGVFVGAVSLGTAGQSRAENSSVSRVQFSIPVALPS